MPLSGHVAPDLFLGDHVAFGIGTLASGLVLRSRMSKEEYARLGLADGRKVSLQIRNYRILTADDGRLDAEVATNYEMPPNLGDGI